jgi:hypothetical protein
LSAFFVNLSLSTCFPPLFNPPDEFFKALQFLVLEEVAGDIIRQPEELPPSSSVMRRERQATVKSNSVIWEKPRF